MSNEKIMILKMLEEGKIKADEAAKLLNAIKEDETPNPSSTYTHTPPPTATTTTDNTPIPNRQPQNNVNTGGGSSINFDEFGRALGSFSKDMAKKVGVFAKEVTPKLQSITESLVEKTVSVTEKISKSVSAPPTPPKPTPPPPPRPTPVSKPQVKSTSTPPIPRGRQKEKSCEIAVDSSGVNEFYINSKNGMISIKGYNGDKISAKIIYVSNNDNIDISQSGNRYYLDYDDGEFSSVSIEAFVPEKLFRRMQIIAVNSKINLDGSSADEIIIDTTLASISLKNINSNYIKAVTDKGEVSVSNINSNTLEVITANAKIDATSLDVQNLKMETDNAPINYKEFSLRNFNNYNMRISTSNSNMRVNLPITEDIGYDIKAQTSLSSVYIGISGLTYIYNESNYVQGKTSNYDVARRKVKIELDTSNGPINVN